MVLKKHREAGKQLDAALKEERAAAVNKKLDAAVNARLDAIEEEEAQQPFGARRLDDVRHSQIVRILFIIRDLDRTGGMDRYELATKYNVSDKTIQRDIETLQTVGIPIVEEEGPGQRKLWRIAFREQMQKVAALFDVSHYFALIFSLRQGSALRGTPIFTDAEDLGDKLLEFLGENERAMLRDLDNCFYSAETHAYKAAAVDVIWPLAMAITKKRVITVTYQKEGSREIKTHNVLPLKLMVHTGAVYLVHRFEGSKTLGKLKLNRFRAPLQIHERSAERPSEPQIEAYLTRGFGLSPGGKMTHYKFHFRADKYDAVHERFWHHTQKIKDLPDGSVILEFDVGESPEVTAWVCSWRDGIRVLAPLAEIQRMYDFCKWGVEYYESKLPQRRGPKPKVKAPQIAPERLQDPTEE